MLPKLLCPMCRRELPGSAGAVPAWFAKMDFDSGSGLISLPQVKQRSRAGSMPIGQRSRRRAQRSGTSSLDLSVLVATVDLSLLPRRLSKTILALSRKEGTGQSIEVVLDCADTFAEDASSVSAWEARGAFTSIITELSRFVGQQVAEMPLDEFIVLAPRLSEALRANILVPAFVLTAVRTQVSRASESMPDGHEHPAHAFLELEKAIGHLFALRGLEAFAQIVDVAAPGIAQQTFEIIRLASLDDMPAAMFHGFQVLESWPAAAREATAALRIWVPARLHQLAQRWAQGPDSKGPPPAVERLPVDWWVRVLSSSCARGLFEQTRLTELCSILAGRFVDEGIRTLATQSWSSSESQDIVSREFVAALMQHPQGVVLTSTLLVFQSSDVSAAFNLRLSLPSSPGSGSPLSPLSPTSPLSPERRISGSWATRRSPSEPGCLAPLGGGSNAMWRGASSAGFDDWRGTRVFTAGLEGRRTSGEPSSRSRTFA